MTVIIGKGGSRDRVFSVEEYNNITQTYYKQISANESLFLAAVPDWNKIDTQFIMSFNAQGYEVEVDLSFQKKFWGSVIGILVSIGVVVGASIGTWLYYQKYGNLNLCKNILTCRWCRAKIADMECT